MTAKTCDLCGATKPHESTKQLCPCCNKLEVAWIGIEIGKPGLPPEVVKTFCSNACAEQWQKAYSRATQTQLTKR